MLLSGVGVWGEMCENVWEGGRGLVGAWKGSSTPSPRTVQGYGGIWGRVGNPNTYASPRLDVNRASDAPSFHLSLLPPT